MIVILPLSNVIVTQERQSSVSALCGPWHVPLLIIRAQKTPPPSGDCIRCLCNASRLLVSDPSAQSAFTYGTGNPETRSRSSLTPNPEPTPLCSVIEKVPRQAPGDQAESRPHWFLAVGLRTSLCSSLHPGLTDKNEWAGLSGCC